MPTYPSPYSYLKSQSGGSPTPDSLLLIKGGLLAVADVQELDPVNTPPVTTGARLSYSTTGVAGTRVLSQRVVNLPFNDLASQSISAATWVKFNTTGGGVQRERVFSIRTSGQHNYLELYIESATKLRGVCKRSTPISSVDSTAITTGVWYHVALTWDHSSSALTFYLNGASAVAASGSNNNGNPQAIGVALGARLQNAQQANMDGFLQDFGIWNKALAANEVAAIASAAFDLGTNSGNYQSASDLKLWWSMQKRTGNSTAVVDSSGNLNIGTMAGTYTLSTDVP